MLLVSAILIPTYREDLVGMLVILCGITVPLLFMINLPLVLRDKEPDEDIEALEDLEVLPGNYESAVGPIEVEKKRQRRPFFKLR